jgi:RHS repeat-associated protein
MGVGFKCTMVARAGRHVYDSGENPAATHGLTKAARCSMARIPSERDSCMALDSADQRFYASTYGRFNSPDPYMTGPNGTTNPNYPGVWNQYSYVGDDPVGSYDPSGVSSCVVGASSTTAPRCEVEFGPESPVIANLIGQASDAATNSAMSSSLSVIAPNLALVDSSLIAAGSGTSPIIPFVGAQSDPASTSAPADGTRYQSRDAATLALGAHQFKPDSYSQPTCNALKNANTAFGVGFLLGAITVKYGGPETALIGVGTIAVSIGGIYATNRLLKSNCPGY